MSEITIDINCDLGEKAIGQSPEQLQFLRYVSSCNIATGFHAGDPHTIYQTVREAVTLCVSIGAHPSYPDREGFGRTSVYMSPDELYSSMAYQISALSGICKMAGTNLHHIKLHGALYHDAHRLEEIALVVIQFLQQWPERLLIYGQSNSILHQMAIQHRLGWVSEGFIDRRYDDDGRLLPRSEENAIILDTQSAISQAITMVKDHKVSTVSGQNVFVDVQTLCIHGDHSNSLELARKLKISLLNQGIFIKPPQV